MMDIFLTFRKRDTHNVQISTELLDPSGFAEQSRVVVFTGLNQDRNPGLERRLALHNQASTLFGDIDGFHHVAVKQGWHLL